MNLTPVRRDDFSAPFFDAAARGKLVIRRCVNGHFIAPYLGATAGSAARCPDCQTEEIEWYEATGAATLVSWIVTHLKEDQGGGLKYSGLVEVEEGPWMYALLDLPADPVLSVGLPLTVGFVATDDGGETIPVFRPI